MASDKPTSRPKALSRKHSVVPYSASTHERLDGEEH
jgi:hypothetical protein